MNQFDTMARGDAPAPVSACATRVAHSHAKRAIDLVFALSALAVLAPLLALIALVIWLEDGEPILFRQQRTGLNGRIFRIYKFRTMTVTEDGAQVLQVTRGDRRITRAGALLRVFSLDELPQLFNVLRGDMSLVGPRPHALAHDRAWEKVVPDYGKRFRARPGLTGQAQVAGYRGEIRSYEDISRRVEADNFYIENWSIFLELKIIARTVPLIFSDPKAY